MKLKSGAQSVLGMTSATLLLASLEAHAAKIEITGEEDLAGTLPAFHLDHSGFDLPADFPLQMSGLDANAPALPLFPMFKSQWFAKKFVGVTIPAKYLVSKFTGRADRQLVNESMQRIQQIKLEDKRRLVPYYFQGNVYGVPENIQVVQSSGFTIGLELSFGSDETLVLGDHFVLGASVHLGAPVTYLNGEKGLNAAQSLNDLFQGYDLALHGESTEQVISRTLEFMPYLQYYLAKNAEPSKATGIRIKATYNNQLVLPKKDPKPIAQPIPRGSLSSELKATLVDLKENIADEMKWRSKLTFSVETAAVVNNVEANVFIQEICDHLSQGYEVPKELWPRCRIAATWVPNAWAYPGGDIFITAGLLGILSDLDSVMLILGHEIGHVVARHTSHSIPYMDAFNGSMFALSTVANIALTGFSLGGGFGLMGSVTLLTWFPQMMGASMGGGMVAGKALELLALPPTAALMAYSRDHEWQADRLGQEVAYATGADQNGMRTGWVEFTDWIKKYLNPSDGFFTRLMSDHPDNQDRLAEIDERYKELSQKLHWFNSRNKDSAEVYARYREVHALYRDSVNQWGESVRKKDKDGSDSKALEYTLKSFLAPGGRCVQNALGSSGK